MCAGGELKIAMLLQNNTVETYSLKTTDKNPTGTKTSRITMGDQGAHTLAFSSDNIAVLSASPGTLSKSGTGGNIRSHSTRIDLTMGFHCIS